MIRSDKRLKLLYALSDLIVLFIVFVAANTIFSQNDFVNQDYLYLLTLSLIWIYLTSQNKVYSLHLHNSLTFRTRNHLKNHVQFAALLCLLHSLLAVPVYSSPHFTSFLIGFAVIDLLANFLLYKLVAQLRRQGRNVRKALVVGAGRTGVSIDKYFTDNPDLGYKIIGFIDDNQKDAELQTRILSPISDMGEILRTCEIDEVIIALPTHLHEKIQFVVNKVDYYGIRLRLIPDYTSLLGKPYKSTNLGNIPVINIREISLDRLRLAFLKEVCDFVFSLVVVILLSPVLLALALIIKMDSPGPVFYCPMRVGYRGRPFKVFKFRSMYQGDGTSNAKMSTQKNDSRITPVGRIIRKYSLDELPQFLNVLKGDMSVVGPRPHRLFLDNLMQKEVDQYMIRHYLRPGITGWAQVNGWRGPTETVEQKNNRTSHDIWYVENWTPLLDIKIIYLTVFGGKTFKVAF